MSGPAYHGRTHSPGGTDPIPGLGGGGGEQLPETVVLAWTGPVPASVGAGPVLRVPQLRGADVAFEIDSAWLRLESPGLSVETTVRVQKSAAGGAFGPTDVTSLSAAVGAYENEVTDLADPSYSGQLVRPFWDAIGTTVGGPFSIAVTLVEVLA